MNVQITWDEQRNDTIRWQVAHLWTLADYEDAVKRTTLMMKQRPRYKINILVDMTETYSVPTGVITALIQCHHRISETKLNYGKSVIVSQKPVVRLVFPMLETITATREHIYLAQDFKQAYDLLNRLRPSVYLN